MILEPPSMLQRHKVKDFEKLLKFNKIIEKIVPFILPSWIKPLVINWTRIQTRIVSLFYLLQTEDVVMLFFLRLPIMQMFENLNFFCSA